jgi:hypothetical protein
MMLRYFERASVRIPIGRTFAAQAQQKKKQAARGGLSSLTEINWKGGGDLS